MDGWMNEWMDGWMNEWMNEWMNGWMNEWMNEWVNKNFPQQDSFYSTDSPGTCQTIHSGRLKTWRDMIRWCPKARNLWSPGKVWLHYTSKYLTTASPEKRTACLCTQSWPWLLSHGGPTLKRPLLAALRNGPVSRSLIIETGDTFPPLKKCRGFFVKVAMSSFKPDKFVFLFVQSNYRLAEKEKKRDKH